MQGDRRTSAVDEPAVVVDTIDRVANVVVTVVPVGLVGVAAWLARGGALRWPDLIVLAVTYLLAGMGVTVGFHGRHPPQLQDEPSDARAAGGTWVGSDRGPGDRVGRQPPQASSVLRREPGDPHNPHVDRGRGWRGALGGLFHAHVGWIFKGDEMASEERYAKDLLDDPVVRFIDRTFLAWVLAGLAFPFGLGVVLTGTIAGGLTGLLWGGAVRLFFVHHATFSINSLCHFFGRQRFATYDELRTLLRSRCRR